MWILRLQLFRSKVIQNFPFFAKITSLIFVSLIIGAHPQQQNFFFANGSSGHGLQHAPAIGRALSEYLTDLKYHSIDLTRFGFQRIVNNTPIFEPMIV